MNNLRNDLNLNINKSNYLFSLHSHTRIDSDPVDAYDVLYSFFKKIHIHHLKLHTSRDFNSSSTTVK